MSSSAASTPEPDGRPDEQPATGGGSTARSASPPAASRPPPGRDSRPTSRAEQRQDPHADFLITSADRDDAEARLRQAVADGAIELDEFGERMRAVLEARTRGDLQQATAGIYAAAQPLNHTRARGTARAAPKQQHIIAILGESAARGRWRPAESTTALAILGSATVDLQGAELDGDELTISATAFLGTVEIVVPEGIEVELSGFEVLGERSMKLEGPVAWDAPLVKVDAYAVLGEVKIRHPKKKERFERDDGRGAFANRVPLTSVDAQDATRRTRRRRSARVSAVRRWAAGLLAAAAIGLPLGWVLSSDDVAGAVFGGNDHIVNTQGLEAGDVMTVGAPVAFGGVTVEIPEGVQVEKDGIVIFGATECTACADQVAADAPTVQVRTLGAFGGVEIKRIGAPDAG